MACKLARAYGADTIGESLIGAGEEQHMPEHVWDEVLDFLQYVHAELLVVIHPDEIAPDFADYCRRTDMLERAGIELAIWAIDQARTLEESTAA